MVVYMQSMVLNTLLLCLRDVQCINNDIQVVWMDLGRNVERGTLPVSFGDHIGQIAIEPHARPCRLRNKMSAFFTGSLYSAVSSLAIECTLP